MKEASKYFGFAAVATSWVGFTLCITLQTPEWSEPVSQFGYSDTTRLFFGLALTLTAILYYLFTRQLDPYWSHASQTGLLTGVFLLMIAWVPYEPYARSFVLDIHNTAVALAAVFYSLPMLCIGYKKAHHRIARISQILFFVTVLLTALSLVARLANVGIIQTQILAILPVHVWLILTNVLLLHHRKEITAGYSGKL